MGGVKYTTREYVSKMECIEFTTMTKKIQSSARLTGLFVEL